MENLKEKHIIYETPTDGPNGPRWKRRKSMLMTELARRIARHEGWEFDESRRDELSDHILRFVIRARQTTSHNFETERLQMSLRPMSDDDPDGDPVIRVGGSGELPEGQGDELIVTCFMGVESIQRAPADTAEDRDRKQCAMTESEAWREKWSGIEPNFDERDVVGPIWQELEMPGYLIPDLKASEPYDWSKPLEYGMASMPEFSFILPMDHQGKRFGHDDHHIFSWGNPHPTSDKLSEAENETRKVTVKFRYRVMGWTSGWREDHQSKHGIGDNTN